MKRMKKLLALALTGAMILSCTVFASAEEETPPPPSDLSGNADSTNASSGGASGKGSSEGPLPADTIAVVLPTSVTADYNMILDPHHLLKDTAYQRFGNVWGEVVTGQDDGGNDITAPGYTTENVRFSNEDAKLFFKNSDATEAVAATTDDEGNELTPAVDAAPALYSNVSNAREIINMGLMDINVELDIAITKGDADFVSFVATEDALTDEANGGEGAQVYFALQSQNLEVAAEASEGGEDGENAAATMPTQVTVGGTGNLLDSATVEFGATADADVFTDAVITITAADGEGGGTVTQYNVTGNSNLNGYTLTLNEGAITVTQSDAETGDSITFATITLTGLKAFSDVNDTDASTLTLSVPTADSGEAVSVTKAVGEDGTAAIVGKIGHLDWDTVKEPKTGAGFRKIWQQKAGQDDPTVGSYVYDRIEQDQTKYPSATYNLTGAINEHSAWDGYAIGKDTFKVDLTWKITKDGETTTGGSSANANAEPTVKVTSVASADYSSANASASNNKTTLTLTMGSGTNEYTSVHRLLFTRTDNNSELKWIITPASGETKSTSVALDGNTLTINASSVFRNGKDWAIEFTKADGTSKLVSFNALQVG